MNRWTKNADQRREDYYYDALVFSRHNTDLVFDGWNIEPEKLAKAPENAGIDPSAMRVSKCTGNQLAKMTILTCHHQAA